MGVKGFAWVGGFALFLGVTFFIKYSFDNNLISPQVQVAIGFLAGIGLLVGGTLLHSRQQYVIGAQALCATGVVILYAVTFASRVHYHFLEWPGARWDALPAFGLMALITATGFFLAVRLDALVVAILGMLGGFLTPILLSHRPGQSARPVRLHRHSRRRADFRRAEQTLAFPHGAGRARHRHHANRLGGRVFRPRKIF